MTRSLVVACAMGAMVLVGAGEIGAQPLGQGSVWTTPPPLTTTPPPPPPPAPAAAAPTLPPPPAAVPNTTLTLPTTAATTGDEVGGPTRVPALTRERLRLLNTTLIPLAERSRDSRRSEGILNVVVGAAIITLGVLLEPEGGSVSPFSSLLYFQGGWTGATGLLQLVWAPDRERLSYQFQQMPMRTAAERRARVRFGEMALDEMARDGSRRRLLSALGGVGFGLGTLGIIYRDQIFNGAPWPEPPEVNYLVIGISAIPIVMNLIQAFSRSEEERLRDTYRRELQLLRETSDVGN